MQKNWFLEMLGVVDDALDLLLTGAVLVALVLFVVSLADTRGLESIMNALFGFSHG